MSGKSVNHGVMLTFECDALFYVFISSGLHASDQTGLACLCVINVACTCIQANVW